MPCSTCTLALHVVMRATAQNCEALRCGQSEWRITSSSTLWNASALTSMLEAMPYCTCKLTPYVVMRATARNCEACWCYDCGEALKIEFLIIVPESWSSALIKSLTHSFINSSTRISLRKEHAPFFFMDMNEICVNKSTPIDLTHESWMRWMGELQHGRLLRSETQRCLIYVSWTKTIMSAITIEALTSRVYADFGLCAFDNSGISSICNQSMI